MPTVVITSGTSHTVPSDFVSLTSIEGIGGGGTGLLNGASGKGANYAKITSLPGIAALNVYTIQVGAGGGTTGSGTSPTSNTVYDSATPSLIAAGADSTTTNSVGSTVFAGGANGVIRGGSGAGGPNGAGNSSASTNNGSAGDAGFGGAGGTFGIAYPGNSGGAGTEMSGGVGAGGGGADAVTAHSGDGGNYGGGSGSCVSSGTPGVGAPGVLVFVYTSSTGSVTLVGVGASGAVGNVTFGNNSSVNPVGAAGVGHAGFVSISSNNSTSVPLQGVAAVGRVGLLGPLVPVALPLFKGVFDKRDPNEWMQAISNSAFDELHLGGWDTTWHKDAARFTVAAIVYVPSSVACVILSNLSNGANGFGYIWEVDAAQHLTLIRANGSGSFTTNNSGSFTASLNGWSFVAVSVNENGGPTASYFRIGSNVATFDANLASPPIVGPFHAARILGTPDASVMSPAGFRVMTLQAWNRALSQADTWRLYRRWKTERMSGLI